MPDSPRVLALGGSLRRGSLNKRLAHVAAEAARAAGAEVAELDLRDHPMPCYDGDLEDAEGLPDGARSFKAALSDHDAWLLACPEYNGSIPGTLKNAIDWASRREGDEPPLSAFRGKVVALLAASPGALGGLRGLVAVRTTLTSVGCLVLPDQLAVPRAHEAFGADGRLADEKTRERVEAIARRLVEVARRLR